MSFNNNFLEKLNGYKQDLETLFEVKPSQSVADTRQKSSSSSHNYLTAEERKAFAGLCALEGKSEVEKLAELVKDYIDKKKKRL
ncbi:hypothetical protein [Crocosphaera sp. XPORK-15E]|uniref:hypothetical protein n=1 Tax=Crocosphaera sp. XPORK-15E TaxID=3110247 RepID=UPI002B21980E|nr:hypothetical protein [Crocosphaera sp. XPORK-15E]MEA5536706.1 hypothetical protein [Crocosphaera sp. XPORK-15E]